MNSVNLVKGKVYTHPLHGAVKYIGKVERDGNIEYEFWESKNRLFHFIDPKEL